MPVSPTATPAALLLHSETHWHAKRWIGGLRAERWQDMRQRGWEGGRTEQGGVGGAGAA